MKGKYLILFFLFSTVNLYSQNSFIIGYPLYDGSFIPLISYGENGWENTWPSFYKPHDGTYNELSDIPSEWLPKGYKLAENWYLFDDSNYYKVSVSNPTLKQDQYEHTSTVTLDFNKSEVAADISRKALIVDRKIDLVSLEDISVQEFDDTNLRKKIDEGILNYRDRYIESSIIRINSGDFTNEQKKEFIDSYKPLKENKYIHTLSLSEINLPNKSVLFFKVELTDSVEYSDCATSGNFIYKGYVDTTDELIFLEEYFEFNPCEPKVVDFSYPIAGFSLGNEHYIVELSPMWEGKNLEIYQLKDKKLVNVAYRNVYGY